jgi:hypothetical protein
MLEITYRKVEIFATSFPEHPTFSSRPAVPMNSFKKIVPILASTSQLTCLGKHYVPGKASNARIFGPRMRDVTLPSLPETNAASVNADDTHPPSE